MPTITHTPYNRNRFPFFQRQRFVIVQRPVACKSVYDNQSTIDALNQILAGCTNLKVQGRAACNSSFVAGVENELTKQLSIAKVVGQNCSSANVVPTYVSTPIIY